jgi:hypothetical protein
MPGFFLTVSQAAPPNVDYVGFEIPDAAVKTKTPRPSLASASCFLLDHPARC